MSVGNSYWRASSDKSRMVSQYLSTPVCYTTNIFYLHAGPLQYFLMERLSEVHFELELAPI